MMSIEAPADVGSSSSSSSKRLETDEDEDDDEDERTSCEELLNFFKHLCRTLKQLRPAPAGTFLPLIIPSKKSMKDLTEVHR